MISRGGLLAFALGLACGGRTTASDDDSSSLGSSGGTSSTTLTGGDPNECGCGMASYADPAGCGFDEMFADVPQCPGQTPCPTLTVTCPMGQMDLYDCKPAYEYDGQAIACMLAAFRDRTPGRYDIEGDMDYGPNTGQSMLEIRIREDGTAIHNWCWHTDAGIEWTNASARPLADPADYDECMNDPSPAARYGCLVDAFGEGVDLPRCQ